MKVLYGIQCTGNGHITRSVVLIEQLRQYVEVDVLTSGNHSEIELPFPVKYKLRGVSYYFGKKGTFNITKTASEVNFGRFIKELNALDLSEYDMVISDFEPLSAWCAKKQDIYCVALSNQAALTSAEVPKPDSFSPISKWLLRALCPSDIQYGLFYKKYGPKLFFPPIRDKIKFATPTTLDYYVVYLPFYGDEKLIKQLSNFPDAKWMVFSKHSKLTYQINNVHINPVSEDVFIQALVHCKGVMCSAGFGTTAEALYLKKKLMVIPMKNQYEQLCNAHVLQTLGAATIPKLKKKHHRTISEWLKEGKPLNLLLHDESNKLVKNILVDYIQTTSTTRVC